MNKEQLQRHIGELAGTYGLCAVLSALRDSFAKVIDTSLAQKKYHLQRGAWDDLETDSLIDINHLLDHAIEIVHNTNELTIK
jgi:hypothetical protein